MSTSNPLTTGWAQPQDPYEQFGGGGPIKDLENLFKAWTGSQYAVAVNSATMGLEGLIRGIGLGRGDEVITTPLTVGATIGPLLRCSVTIIFADTDPETGNIDPKAVQELITSKTRLILAVDLFGRPHDTETLRRIADKHSIHYFADAAQSLGATINGRQASHAAHARVHSFTTGKTIYAGEGGIVLTDDTELYEYLLWETQHPARQHHALGWNGQNEFGLNGRINPFGAEHAVRTFDQATNDLEEKQERYFRLIQALNETGLTVPIRINPAEERPAFFRLSALWKDRPQPVRLLRSLKEQVIEAMLHPLPFTPLHQHPYLDLWRDIRVFIPETLKNADDFTRRAVCITHREPRPGL